MKVIFLDIDGVLNDAYSTERTPLGYIGIDDDKLGNLRKIVSETGAYIVLTSTWKVNWKEGVETDDPDGQYLMKRFAKVGLAIYGKTDDQWVNRGRGITDWIKAHGVVESWVVIDDIQFKDFPRYGIMKHFVQTSFAHEGLNEELTQKCIDILNKKE